MSVEADSSVARISFGNYTTGQPIKSNDWKDLIKATHLIYMNSGVVSAGLVFDPVFTTTSTSFTSANGSGGRALDTYFPQLRQPQRAWESSAEKLFAGFTAFGENIIVKAVVLAADTGGLIGTLEVNSTSITAADQPYIYGATNVVWSTAFEGSSKSNSLRTISMRFEVKHNGDGANATLYSICPQYIALEADEIPLADL